MSQSDANTSRISKVATITLSQDVKVVFPLFGPLREKAWAQGWDPEILYGESEADLHMIFRTNARYPDEQRYTWIITQYKPAEYFIEYTVSTNDRIWFITVQCVPKGKDTQATIRYTYTALTKPAAERNQDALNAMFATDLHDWEEAINYYLKTGKKLE